MNNSLIYLTTPSTANVAADGVLPLTTIVRRRGASIQQSNDSVVLGAPGYYHVSVNATFTAPVAGDVTFELRQDNLPVSGGTATTTITTALTETRSLSFEAIIRVTCCSAPVTLSIVNTGVSITTSNISLAVEYLD